jgi:hypothetical protein
VSSNPQDPPTGGGPPQEPATGARVVGNISTTAAELPDPGKPGIVIVAPAKGTIDHPAETPVGVVLVAFTKSPTIRWILGILVGALVTVAVKLQELLTAPTIDWHAVWTTYKAEIVVMAFSAFAAYMKTHDNNPTNPPRIP